MTKALVTNKDTLKQMALVFAVPFLVVLLYGMSARAYLSSATDTNSEEGETFAQIQTD